LRVPFQPQLLTDRLLQQQQRRQQQLTDVAVTLLLYNQKLPAVQRSQQLQDGAVQNQPCVRARDKAWPAATSA
jgi:hypothetical protein